MYGWPLGAAYPPPFTHQSTPNANASQSAPPGVNVQPMMSSFWPQTNVTQNQGGDIDAAAQGQFSYDFTSVVCSSFHVVF